MKWPVIFLILLASLIFSCGTKRIEYLPDSRKIIDTRGMDFSMCPHVGTILFHKYCFDIGYWDSEVADKIEKCRAILKTKKEDK